MGRRRWLSASQVHRTASGGGRKRNWVSRKRFAIKIIVKILFLFAFSLYIIVILLSLHCSQKVVI